MNRLHGRVLSLMVCLLAVTVSGCMIGPTNGEHIGGSQNQIIPGGFVLEGDMLMEVQVYNLRMNRWVTEATTRSKKGAIAWEGYDWYYWQSPPITISPDLWVSSGFEPTGEGPHNKTARLRVLANGQPVYTFNEWNLGPLRDMAAEIHGKDVFIYATDIYIE